MSFCNNTPVSDKVSQWSELFDDSTQIPRVRLDSIILGLTRLRSSASHLLRLPKSDEFGSASQVKHLHNAAKDIDRRLEAWKISIPGSWTPTQVFGDQCIPPSVKKAGLYQGYCDVYPGIFHLTMWNKYRLSLIDIKRIIIGCLDKNPSSPSLAEREACQTQIQEVVDDICASIPYFLGDRTQPGCPGDSVVKYPLTPEAPPTKDHCLAGPTQGGWAILEPMTALLKMDITMRDGQRQWLEGQMARTTKVYRIGSLDW
ncbi:hypothetical protein OIDMADRAFT_22333 [Oidiodendron maius Zn]|uniref:Uncharacterized protein n=1 Tax=Oidiodendron maius (strain Zn) TaxID=913774 RepID=A0A0C3HWZ5_OIDMZ|nr:hypothetical protein OIDMADRAFT_22333 [Oidiodendron maius Zn]